MPKTISTEQYALTGAKLAQDMYQHKWWYRFYGIAPMDLDNVYTEHYKWKKGKSFFMIGRKFKTVDLVICGSDNDNDWFGKDGNLNLYLRRPKDTDKGKVSAGFLYAFENNIQKIAVKKINDMVRKTGVRTLRIIGHSRGGGVAPIAARILRTIFAQNIGAIQVFCYNAPSCGDRDFYDGLVKDTNGSLFYYRTKGDLVSRLPFKWLGYHVYPNVTMHVNKKGFPMFIKWLWPILSHTPVYIVSLLSTILNAQEKNNDGRKN